MQILKYFWIDIVISKYFIGQAVWEHKRNKATTHTKRDEKKIMVWRVSFHNNVIQSYQKGFMPFTTR